MINTVHVLPSGIEKVYGKSAKEQIQFLLDFCLRMWGYEQEALMDDDPESTCAAHHRGEINAYSKMVMICTELLNHEE